MAFSTSNVVRENSGSTNVMRGSWAGTAGDDVGTVTGNGYAMDAEFDTNDTVTPGEIIPARITNSNGTWTVTVPYHDTYTSGSFRIIFK